MYNIVGQSIWLTRGDSFSAEISPQLNDTTYTPLEGDVIKFYLKRNLIKLDNSGYVDANPLIQKTIPNDTMILEISPSDTKQLAFGDYVYDVELTYADGTVDTFINNALFKIVPEVD